MKRRLTFALDTDEVENAADGSEGSVVRMIMALEKLRDQVPEEHRDSVSFRISTEDDYYGSYSWVNFEASWSREQTDEEVAIEQEIEKQRASKAYSGHFVTGWFGSIYGAKKDVA